MEILILAGILGGYVVLKLIVAFLGMTAYHENKTLGEIDRYDK